MRDLTDPAHGPHTIQLIVDDILEAVGERWPGPTVVHRGQHVVDVADNYDRLGYGTEAKARDARYSRYVGAGRMLRSQTSALVPGGLRGMAYAGMDTGILACPGMVYRRDVIDRLHTGTPHQLDVWPIGRRGYERGQHGGARELVESEVDGGGGVAASKAEGSGAVAASEVGDDGLYDGAGLRELVDVAVTAALPGCRWRARAARHPYTTDGLEIEVDGVEVGEAGIAARLVLDGAGLPAYVRGLALGLGLDRLVMLRKGISDIRLLRSADPRVVAQLTDLAPYRPVSAQPAAWRDVSVAMPAGVTAEDVGDRVRELLGTDACLVEEVRLLAVTPAEELPEGRLRRGEVNVLLRMVLRDLHASLPRQRVNALRDRVLAGWSS